MPASAYEMRRKCGKKNCICVTKGKLHPVWVVSFKSEGKNRLKAIPKEKMSQFKTLTKRYQEFRRVRKRLIAVQQEAILIIDKIQERRTLGAENEHHKLWTG